MEFEFVFSQKKYHLISNLLLAIVAIVYGLTNDQPSIHVLTQILLEISNKDFKYLNKELHSKNLEL